MEERFEHPAEASGLPESPVPVEETITLLRRFYDMYGVADSRRWRISDNRRWVM